MRTKADANRLLDSIAQAKAQVRHAKQHMPYLFPEWARLKAAEETLKQAEEARAAAQAAWDRLGA